MSKPRSHIRKTKRLASLLPPKEIYNWLVSGGYFPESYVLPPCFNVSRHPNFGKCYFPVKNKDGKQNYNPDASVPCEIHFPRTDLTNRTFGVIDPKIHSDIAYEISSNWADILSKLFSKENKVYSYSFPIPVDSKKLGQLGNSRIGRMIYEWIEMAETDLAEEAYAYKYLLKSDIKNFYPSIYTHSIAWALHTKENIRQKPNRYDYERYFGNRLDKLFQSAGDGCTNGIPIGPAASDLIGEIILSAVDTALSPIITETGTLAVRFKDDYRFLCNTKSDCDKIIRALQKELREFKLLVNEEKTCVSELPDGLFREWRSEYETIVPGENVEINFSIFKEFYLNVLRIDRNHPGTGVIDKFIGRLISKSYSLRLSLPAKDVGKVVSLLVLMADRRAKSFPRILAVIELLMSYDSGQSSKTVTKHLNTLLKKLCADPTNNCYLIAWILYFLKSNKLEITSALPAFEDPILRSMESEQNHLFSSSKDFKLFRGPVASIKSGVLAKHLDVFNPQQ